MTFRQLTVLLLFSLLAIGVCLIVAGQPLPNIRQDKRTPSAKSKEAKKLFKQNCVRCHGEDGVGDTPFGEIVGAADLTDPEWQKRVDDQQLVNSMTYGRGQMPPFGKKLRKEQIAMLLAYVRAFKR
jgi:mono/diheme cytochrome c family protein